MKAAKGRWQRGRHGKFVELRGWQLYEGRRAADKQQLRGKTGYQMGVFKSLFGIFFITPALSTVIPAKAGIQ